MKYLVLKQLAIEKKMKTNLDSTSLRQNDDQSATYARHFLSSNTKKRFRSAFTTEQINYLEKEFKKFPYIGSGNRKEVSSLLNIPERAVKIWFQNRRMKEKKDFTNKETIDEEQNKINIAFQGQPNIKALNHQTHNTQPYTVCQSKLKTIYTDPSTTKDSIKHLSDYKNNTYHEYIEDKQRIKMKNLNNGNLTETKNNAVVNKMAPVVSELTNKAYLPMKMLQNKNICITRLLPHELPLNRNLDNGKLKQENLKDLTSETKNCSRVIQPNYYHVTPNHDQRYNPLHVHTLPGNVLWKSVNVMPVLPGVAAPPPQVVHNNSYSLIHTNFPKDDCKCSCKAYNTSQEMSPLMQLDGRLHLQSQYILAMPINHFDRI